MCMIGEVKGLVKGPRIAFKVVTRSHQSTAGDASYNRVGRKLTRKHTVPLEYRSLGLQNSGFWSYKTLDAVFDNHAGESRFVYMAEISDRIVEHEKGYRSKSIRLVSLLGRVPDLFEAKRAAANLVREDQERARQVKAGIA